MNYVTNLRTFSLTHYLLIEAAQNNSKLPVLNSGTKKAEEVALARLGGQQDASARSLALVGTAVRADYMNEKLESGYQGNLPMVEHWYVQNWLNKFYDRYLDLKATEDNSTKASREATKVEWDKWYNEQRNLFISEVILTEAFVSSIEGTRQQLVLSGDLLPRPEDAAWIKEKVEEARKAASPLEELLARAEAGL